MRPHFSESQIGGEKADLEKKIFFGLDYSIVFKLKKRVFRGGQLS